jgi:histidinol-phosphate aminotransferase
MCFGPSPRAIEAMASGAAESWKYGEPENYELKQALAKHHGVSAANIVVVSMMAILDEPVW